MSATAAIPLPSPNSPFRAQCVICNQIGLFATVAGFLACGWLLEEGSELPQTIVRGLFLLPACCSRCRRSNGSGKSLLRALGVG